MVTPWNHCHRNAISLLYHTISQVGRDVQRSSGHLYERGTMWDYLAPSPIAQWKPLVMGTLTYPWRGFREWLFSSHWGEKKKFPILSWNISWCDLSSPCMYLWRESLHPLCSLPLNIGTFWWGACKPCLLQGKKICLLQSCLVEQILLVTLLCFFDSLSMSFLMSGDQTCTHHSRCCLIGMMTALSLVLMFLWLQLRFWLICWCCI